MEMYHITYWSGNYRVKGYVAIPDMQPSDYVEVRRWLARLPRLVQVIPIESDVSDVLDFSGLSDESHESNSYDVSSVSGQANETGASARLHATTQSAKNSHPQPSWWPRQRYPALIYCRGGIGRVGMVKLDWVRLFCSYGYVIFAPSYRGTEGGEGRDEFGGADREDVHSGVEWLRELPFVDSNRISLLGFSRGAVNAGIVASQRSDVYRLISWGGVADLAMTYAQRVDLRRMLRRVVGGTPSRVPEAYMERSPAHLANRIHCPVLIVHGTEDVQVDVSHAHLFHDALRKHHVAMDMHLYHGLGHHLPPPLHSAVVDRMFDWLGHRNELIKKGMDDDRKQ